VVQVGGVQTFPTKRAGVVGPLLAQEKASEILPGI
jgi:hypothetical protein